MEALCSLGCVVSGFLGCYIGMTSIGTLIVVSFYRYMTVCKLVQGESTDSCKWVYFVVGCEGLRVNTCMCREVRRFGYSTILKEILKG